MKKHYTAARAELVVLNDMDVIRTSELKDPFGEDIFDL